MHAYHPTQKNETGEHEPEASLGGIEGPVSKQRRKADVFIFILGPSIPTVGQVSNLKKKKRKKNRYIYVFREHVIVREKDIFVEFCKHSFLLGNVCFRLCCRKGKRVN